MVAEELAPSKALLEANRRLYELRERIQADRPVVVGSERPGVNRCLVSTKVHLARQVPDIRTCIADLPEHLGWGSAAITDTLRSSRKRRHEENNSEVIKRILRTEAQDIEVSSSEVVNLQPLNETVKLYPDIALGMLHKELSAAGRLWLLLRHLDQEGRGWLHIAFLKHKLTNKKSKLRICGQRQMRNLLEQGRGVFWERDKERIWLKSAAKVAEALEVKRLTGRPVELPVEVLLGGIRQVRAHFYASFHSGRRSTNPISRAKLEQITNVPERTQRIYEGVAGVESQQNIAVGTQHTAKEVQERAWQHGRAVFEFIDAKGQQGQAGRRYVAWQLPNSYVGCHEPSPKGRQKKINQQIDLVNIGAQGNDLDRDTSRQQVDRLFHSNGLEAGKSYNRNGQDDVYWPASAQKPLARSSQLWQVIPGRKKR
jgi:hypothetical protein